jgi:cobalamin-dependent methionine synthase I
VIKGIQLKEYASWLDEGALFKGQWGLKQARAGDGPTYEELVETEGRPRLRGLLDRLQTDNLLEAAVVYGYFPCVSKDDDLIVLDEAGNERTRFSFPRQRRGRRLCLADFFRPEESGETDVVGAISKIGDEAVRTALYQAAHTMLTRSGQFSSLKRWAMEVARRRGLKRATVALARKLTVVLLRMWTNETEFRFSRLAVAAA